MLFRSLVDIIEKAFVESKAYKVAELVDTIVDHTGGYGEVDPHDTTTEKLLRNCFDSIYAYWLKQGYQGTAGDLKDLLYRYCHRANKFMLFAGTDSDSVTTVRVVADYLKLMHDVRVNSYDPISLFAYSEKAGRWSGHISGMQIRSDSDASDLRADLLAIKDLTLLDFLSVYEKALAGEDQDYTDDDHRFLEVYDNALYNRQDEEYTDDTYSFVAAYLENLGSIDIISSDLVYYLGTDSGDLYAEYMDALNGGLVNLPYWNNVLPSIEDVPDELTAAYEFLKYYENNLDDSLNNLPQGTAVYSNTDIRSTADISNILSLYEDLTYGYAAAYGAYVKEDVSLYKDVERLIGNSTADLINAYNVGLDTGLTGLSGWNGYFPDASEVTGLDTDTTSFKDVYMQYLDEAHHNLPDYKLFFSTDITDNQWLAIVEELMDSEDPDISELTANLLTEYENNLDDGLFGLFGYSGSTGIPSSIEDFLETLNWYTVSTSEEDIAEDNQFSEDLSAIDDEHIDFVTVYNNALLGIGNVQMTDPYFFVNIYETALNAPDEEAIEIDPETMTLRDVYMRAVNYSYNKLPHIFLVFTDQTTYAPYIELVAYYMGILGDLFTGIQWPSFESALEEDAQQSIIDELDPEDPWADKRLVSVDDSHPTLLPQDNGPIWYQWHLSVPAYLDGAHISIAIDATRTGALKYRYSDVTGEWSSFSGKIDVDRSVVTERYRDIADYSNIYTYRYLLPVSIERILTASQKSTGIDTIEYDFRVEFGANTDPVIIEDIITTIDAREILTDARGKDTELYAQIPHTALWNKYFSPVNTVPVATFSWYQYISALDRSGDVSWFRESGSFYIAAQVYPNILNTSLNTFSTSVKTTYFRVEKDDANYFEIYSVCTGQFAEPYPSDTSTLVKLEELHFGVAAVKNNHVTQLETEDLYPTNRAIYKLYIAYDLTTTTFNILCQTDASLPGSVDNAEDIAGFDQDDVDALLNDPTADVDLVSRYMTGLGTGLIGLPTYTGSLPAITSVPDSVAYSYVFTEYYNRYFDVQVNTLPSSGIDYTTITEPDPDRKMMYRNTDGTYSIYVSDTVEGITFTGDSRFTAQSWIVPVRADISTCTGLHELVYYPNIIEDSGTLMALIHTDLSAVPYIE